MEKDTDNNNNNNNRYTLFPDILTYLNLMQENATKALAAIHQERDKLIQLQNEYEANHKKLQHVHFAKHVNLNVGGQRFATSLANLQKYPTSFFGRMFSGEWSLEADANGEYFIDRDPKHFGRIIRFLRDGICDAEDEEETNEIKAEAEYYGIDALIQLLGAEDTKEEGVPVAVASQNFEGSTILSDQHKHLLLSWFTKGDKQWKLLYKSTRDGYGAPQFHQKVDGHLGTYCVIQSDQGYIFGGYTSVDWSGRGIYKADEEAYLFSLKSPHENVPPTKYPIKPERVKNAVYAQSDYLCVFGGGHDLCLLPGSENCRLGHTYSDSTGKGNITFTGAEKGWEVSEVEVYTPK